MTSHGRSAPESAMRKFSVFLVLAVALAYFFMVPEDHAAELPFDGLTVGDPLELDLEPERSAAALPVAADELALPDLYAPTEEQRELVEPESGALASAPADDLNAAGELAFEDGSPRALPGDLAAGDSLGIAISGSVVNAAGDPIPGVRVRVEHPYLPEVLGASGPDGTFHLTPAELRGNLVLATTSWVLLGGRLALQSGVTDNYLIVIAEPVIVYGTIVDENGQPINGASIHGFAPTDTLVPFRTPALPLDHEPQHGNSNARGAFRIGPLPLLAGTQVEIRMTGYATVIEGLPEDPRLPLEIVLTRY